MVRTHHESVLQFAEHLQVFKKNLSIKGDNIKPEEQQVESYSHHFVSSFVDGTTLAKGHECSPGVALAPNDETPEQAQGM